MHWHGELPLWRSLFSCSFMVILPSVAGVLLGLVFYLLDATRMMGLSWTAGWIGTLCAAAWWGRGLHQKFLALLAQGNMVRAVIALALSIGCLAVLCLIWVPETYSTIKQEISASIFDGKDDGGCRAESKARQSRPWIVQAHPEMQRIIASGSIGWGSAKALEAVIQQNPQIKLLELDSYGGLVHEMHLIVPLVEKYQLDTLVLGKCASACTEVFLAGQRRFITPDTRFGFHRSGYCGQPRNAPWDTTEYMTFIYYRERGVSESFAQDALGTAYEDLWQPSPLELKMGDFATHWWSERPEEYSKPADHPYTLIKS